jgi:hypothetical protein
LINITLYNQIPNKQTKKRGHTTLDDTFRTHAFRVLASDTNVLGFGGWVLRTPQHCFAAVVVVVHIVSCSFY